MKCLLTLLFFLTICIITEGQEKCATDEQYTYLMQHNPEYRRLMQKRTINELPNGNARLNAVPDTIPVVVHVIYSVNLLGTFGNASDESIQNMINTLNLTFSATYPNNPTETSGGVNIGLYFKLAMTDPTCRPTSGIVRIDASNDKTYADEGIRVESGGGGISHAQLAEKSYWDNTKYLNIWIVNRLFGSYAAYAHFPTGGNTIHDGIVIRASSINGSNVITHEMGHIFSLRHTFQGASGTVCPINNNCNVDGDKICDTDPVLEKIGCNPLSVNVCTNQSYGDAVYNYLSYSSCQSMFTPMQRDRMRSALFAYRSSLLTSNTEWPGPQSPSVTITSDDADNIINKNQLVTFTATVTGNPTIQYQWLKNKYSVSTDRIYSSSTLVHGDEIVCMIQDPSLVCHTIVTSYSNMIKISTDQKHYVSIYPNPVSDLLVAWTPSDDIKISRFRVFSANGKLLTTKIMDPNNRVNYSLKGRPAGVYFFEFTTNKGKDVIRVLKGY